MMAPRKRFQPTFVERPRQGTAPLLEHPMKRFALWLAGLLASFFCLLPLAQAQTGSDYTQGVSVAASTATIWFKPTSSTTTWVDVHYRLNGGPTQSLRMTFNAGNARHEQNVLTAVAPGNVISYHFTYNKGAPAYNTPSFSFTVGASGPGTVATPTFSPPAGTYSSAQNVAISSSTAGASIRYTTDGSTPTASSPLYGGPVNVATSRTLKAIALASGMTTSAVASAAYTINTGSGFSFTHGVDVNGSNATIWFKPSQTIAWSDVHYKVNAGPQQNFRMSFNSALARHEQTLVVASGNVIDYNFTYSITGSIAVDTAGFRFTVGSTGGGTVATPTFSPAPGTYTTAQTVSLTTSTAGAAIKYTTDGSTPTAASPTYTGPLAVPTTRTIKAIATKAGFQNSAVASGTYTITPNNGGSWNGLTTFNIVNGTNGRWADSQVYWSIIGRDWATGKFVHVDLGGNLIPMSVGDNGALTKNGQAYTNYFYTLAQAKTVTIPAINSARILLSVGGPMYIQVNTDINGNIGYAGANIENPSDPNIDVIFDFGEMAILPKGNPNQGIFVNTTRVDQFGFPVRLRVQGLGGYDRTVGETEGRDALFAKFIAEMPAEFKGLAQAPYAPMRIMAPAHASFNTGGPNANYLAAYIDSVWAKYRTQDLVFTLDNLGTFTGRVTGDQFRFTGGNVPGTFFINGKPTTAMAMLGNGFLDDPQGASNVGTQLQLQAQMCAALNRHVVETPANWHNSAFFYPAGQPANYFAKFWHDHSIDALAYGFAYDDVGNFSPSLHTDAPTVVTFTVGW